MGGNVERIFRISILNALALIGECQIKFFFPAGRWTWFVTEGEVQEDDFIFYGYVIGPAMEWGYFTLSQLKEIKVHYLTVERDLYFKQEAFSLCLARWQQERGISISK